MTRKERKEELENYKNLAENYLKKLLEEKNAREELQKKYDELKNKIETTTLIEPKVMLNKIDYASDVNENIESLETKLINICKKFYFESALTKPFVYRNYPIESECLTYGEWLNEFNKYHMYTPLSDLLKNNSIKDILAFFDNELKAYYNQEIEKIKTSNKEVLVKHYMKIEKGAKQ